MFLYIIRQTYNHESFIMYIFDPIINLEVLINFYGKLLFLKL